MAIFGREGAQLLRTWRAMDGDAWAACRAACLDALLHRMPRVIECAHQRRAVWD